MEQSIIIAGFGGQGIKLAGMIAAKAFMAAGKHVTLYPSYGAEMRGGSVNCEIVVGDDEIRCVHKKQIDYLVALNDLSLIKFLPKVKTGGTVILNTDFAIPENLRTDVKYFKEPISTIAENAGNVKSANMTALGLFFPILGINESIAENTVSAAMPENSQYTEVNVKALKSGFSRTLAVKGA